MQALDDALEGKTPPSKKQRVVPGGMAIENLIPMPNNMCVSSQASHASALPTGRGEGGWGAGRLVTISVVMASVGTDMARVQYYRCICRFG
jgi:hypothetical protein